MIDFIVVNSIPFYGDVYVCKPGKYYVADDTYYVFGSGSWELKVLYSSAQIQDSEVKDKGDNGFWGLYSHEYKFQEGQIVVVRSDSYPGGKKLVVYYCASALYDKEVKRRQEVALVNRLKDYGLPTWLPYSVEVWLSRLPIECQCRTRVYKGSTASSGTFWIPNFRKYMADKYPLPEGCKSTVPLNGGVVVEYRYR